MNKYEDVERTKTLLGLCAHYIFLVKEVVSYLLDKVMRQSCSEAGVSFEQSSLEKELHCLVMVGISVPGLVSVSRQ